MQVTFENKQNKTTPEEYSIDLKKKKKKRRMKCVCACVYLFFISFHKNNKKEYKQLHVPRKWYIKIRTSIIRTVNGKWPRNVNL